MVPSRVAGGLAQSSPSSGIFFQGDGQSQLAVNSHLSSSFGNSSNSILGTGRSNLGPVSGDMNNAVLSGVANSGQSVGASSLVTDANSVFSGGPHLQRSTSINNESYMHLPASPMSFSSNNISMSGSSIMDGSSVVQQNSQHDQNSQQMQQNQQHQNQRQQGASSATSLPMSQTGQVSLPMGARVPGTFIQGPNNLAHVQKKTPSGYQAGRYSAAASDTTVTAMTVSNAIPRPESPVTSHASAAEITATATDFCSQCLNCREPSCSNSNNNSNFNNNQCSQYFPLSVPMIVVYVLVG